MFAPISSEKWRSPSFLVVLILCVTCNSRCCVSSNRIFFVLARACLLTACSFALCFHFYALCSALRCCMSCNCIFLYFFAFMLDLYLFSSAFLCSSHKFLTRCIRRWRKYSKCIYFFILYFILSVLQTFFFSNFNLGCSDWFCNS